MCPDIFTFFVRLVEGRKIKENFQTLQLYFFLTPSILDGIFLFLNCNTFSSSFHADLFCPWHTTVTFIGHLLNNNAPQKPYGELLQSLYTLPNPLHPHTSPFPTLLMLQRLFLYLHLITLVQLLNVERPYLKNICNPFSTELFLALMHF